MTNMDIETFFNTTQQSRFSFPGHILWGENMADKVFGIVGSKGTVVVLIDRVFEDHHFVKELKAKLGERISAFESVSDMPKNNQLEALAKRVGASPSHIIAIGGGSTNDLAKALIAWFYFGTYDGVGIGEKRGMKPLENVPKPNLIAIPTTAGTGAEASRYYVVYDYQDHSKIYGRSWQLVADWILLDARFMTNTPDPLLLKSAFDAFLHLFESMICRQECSWSGEMLSLDGISRIIGVFAELEADDKKITQSQYLELLYAATMGGVAISNVRTGNIHEAAGALLERTALTHPETLFVFFRTALEQYRDDIEPKTKMLLSALALKAPQYDWHSLEDIIVFWEQLFEKYDLTKGVVAQIGAIADRDETQAHILERLVRDKVWMTKESPVDMNEDKARQLVAVSLDRFSL